jgi:hypothetical protein
MTYKCSDVTRYQSGQVLSPVRFISSPIFNPILFVKKHALSLHKYEDCSPMHHQEAPTDNLCHPRGGHDLGMIQNNWTGLIN